jgi:GGDEF domain-containing protein
VFEIGVSLIDNRTESYEEVYGYADNALYFAKSKGKNYVVLELKP